jgi:hypothetical protein
MPLSCANRSWSQAEGGGVAQTGWRRTGCASTSYLKSWKGRPWALEREFDALRGGVIDYDDDGAPLAGHPKDGS